MTQIKVICFGLTMLGVGSVNDTLFAGDANRARPELEVVVCSGDEAPRANAKFALLPDDWQNWSRHYAPAIGARGTVGFSSALDEKKIGKKATPSIWVYREGTLTLVARRGQRVPGTGVPMRFESLDPQPVVNSASEVAFHALLISNVPYDSENLENKSRLGAHGVGGRDGKMYHGGEGVFRWADGTVTNLASTPMVDGDRRIQTVKGPTLLNSKGQSAFHDKRAVWYCATAGTPRVVEAFRDRVSDLVLNDAGVLAWRTNPWTDGQGLVLSTRGDRVQIVTSPKGPWMFVNQFAPTINNRGQIAFDAVTSAGISRIFVSDKLSSEPRWIPYVSWFTASGKRVTYSVSAPLLDGTGNVVYIARGQTSEDGSGTRPSAIVRYGGEKSRLVFKSGDRAPGTPAGVSFAHFDEFAVNGAGHIAFRASLEGSGVSEDNAEGLWVKSDRDTASLIVRSGASLDSRCGQSSEVSDFAFVAGSNGEDGKAQCMSAMNQVVFWAKFKDGSQGVFVADYAAR